MKNFLSWLAAILLTGTLTGCGGGGGSDTPPSTPVSSSSSSSSSASSAATFSVSTNQLTFSASSPLAARPAAATLTGTVTGNLSQSGILYILVSVSGQAVSSVSNFSISGTTGQATVTPALPYDLGQGNFSGAITVRACLNSPTCASGELAGSPQVINASYTVALPTPGDSVMPHVIVSGSAGQVIVRGHGLSTATSVSFGTTPATSIAVVSDTEIRAQYPASLPVQTLPISINGGSISFSGSVVVLSSQTYSAQALSLPEPPSRILTTLYDMERRAFYVVIKPATGAANQLWRYRYSGSAWVTTPDVLPITNAQDVKLSNDGSRVVALTNTSVIELDPSTSASLRTITGPFPAPAATGSPYLKAFAFANDGNAVVATGAVGINGNAVTYMYSTAAGMFITALPASYNLYSSDTDGSPLLQSSADGSVILAGQNGISPATFYQYSPRTLVLRSTPITTGSATLVIDATGAKRVIHYLGGAGQVYDANNVLLGTTAGNNIEALAIDRAGTRLYTYNTDNTLHVYDLTTSTNSAYPEIGSGSSVTGLKSVMLFGVRMELTPDGKTLFLIGDGGLRVLPAP